MKSCKRMDSSAPNIRTITVPLEPPSRRYSAMIGSGLLGALAAYVDRLQPRPSRVHAIVDEGIPSVVADDRLERLRHSFVVSSSTLQPSEEGKSLQTVQAMLVDMTRANLERGDLVVALGGGIVGDLAGFTAASYKRGIRWVNCPSTLLSMVDASVGGKTGCNLRIGNSLKKNMVGAFWQPSHVLADVELLRWLDERTYRAGLAECIKHGLIGAQAGDDELLPWTAGVLDRLSTRDSAVLIELIARNIQVKAKIVGTDEREEAANAAGGRALLNLGHTFGHAIETLPQVSPTSVKELAPLQHGEAVALGLICAARCAELLKLVGTGLCERVRHVLGHAGLPVIAHNLPTSAEVLELMQGDKKTSGGKLRLVLPSGEHQCSVIADPPRHAVLEAIDAIRA
jgi:3-dehydroquinate synthase